MAENLCSSLALAFTRQENLNTVALNFMANNGNYTLARRQEGIELLANLISLRNTFEEINEKWEGIVKSIVDAAEKADAQALYELHAFGIGDPNVIPYRLIMGDISDIIAEVECEVFFITRDLKGTT
uniref:Uncharacterized protein n=1 Tax=Panagrolaimus sp. PS1159 TaxID=55785 RepID=A0AC35GDJ0_9BILA